ncbi:UdgX family uracil-DNA binding protein [Cupriavidus cauae]|uniref:Type-4 uracil-DNA glycosylase n=1 Tax=Cupriavidus cauae TaxID=2608999 RepID=A0A5M8AAZ8_9BURK|nr:UdgX family uracil-DNA binding protein [Cupriavidus cauae]KAA6120967.1 UdgX family uracil-DNA binding protein [Cupriavidus cauae]
MSGAGPRTLVVECGVECSVDGGVDGGYASWRAQALRALAAGWPPETVTWTERGSAASGGTEQLMLLGPGAAPVSGDDAPVPGDNAPVSGDNARAAGDNAPVSGDDAVPAARPDTTGAAPDVRVSKALAALLQDAARYRSPQRWAFLYRVLWRWCQGDRAVASAADEDGARLHAMAKAVRRAHHDMIAYVRFHRRGGDGMPEYLAWYEPEHDVLADAADHFARRMGGASWWIGTPQGAALWDGHALQFSGTPADALATADIAALRAGAAADDIEPLWLAYYRSIFNPARLNEAALEQHMPVRFWKGLPEGRLIPAMIADARNGARRVAQAGAVGTMKGKPVAVDAQDAQPLRPAPSSLDQCRRCELWRHATQAVPGHGPETARIMLVGEQPGDQEDLAGRAFVGPAGKVLDEAMRRAGVPPDSVYVTNAVKHFKWIPRGKRRLHKTPGQREVEACAHWLDEERARVRPAVIVTLGATALAAILGQKASLRDYLNRPVRLGDAWVVATWHPSYALRVDDAGKREDIVAAIGQAIAQGRELAAAPAPPARPPSPPSPTPPSPPPSAAERQ